MDNKLERGGKFFFFFFFFFFFSFFFFFFLLFFFFLCGVVCLPIWASLASNSSIGRMKSWDGSESVKIDPASEQGITFFHLCDTK